MENRQGESKKKAEAGIEGVGEGSCPEVGRTLRVEVEHSDLRRKIAVGKKRVGIPRVDGECSGGRSGMRPFIGSFGGAQYDLLTSSRLSIAEGPCLVADVAECGMPMEPEWLEADLKAEAQDHNSGGRIYFRTLRVSK